MKITLNDKYQTRSGLEYIGLSTDSEGALPITGKVKTSGGWKYISHTADGSFWGGNKKDSFDLILIPETKTPEEQVAELLAIANAATSRKWFTGAPPTIGWYPAGFITRTSYLHQVAYWHGDRWSYFLDYYDEREHMANMLHNCHDVSKVKWTTPWWPSDWNQAYWEKQV